MTMDYDIERTLILSTVHLPAAEHRYADSDCTHEDDFGWTFYVQSPGEPIRIMDAKGKFTDSAPVLHALKVLAQRLGCTHLRLDADGQKRPELTQYEW